MSVRVCAHFMCVNISQFSHIILQCFSEFMVFMACCFADFHISKWRIYGEFMDTRRRREIGELRQRLLCPAEWPCKATGKSDWLLLLLLGHDSISLIAFRKSYALFLHCFSHTLLIRHVNKRSPWPCTDNHHTHSVTGNRMTCTCRILGEGATGTSLSYYYLPMRRALVHVSFAFVSLHAKSIMKCCLCAFC